MLHLFESMLYKYKAFRQLEKPLFRVRTHVLFQSNTLKLYTCSPTFFNVSTAVAILMPCALSISKLPQCAISCTC